MVVKKFTGKVVANKMDKTIIVAVTNKVAHKKYSKTISKTKKYFVHDENNQYIVGDIVQIRPSRPISKNKCWTVLQDIT